MAIVCNIVALTDLRLCDEDGLINVIMAQPGFTPRRNEETGYGPSPDDLSQVESFVDECLAALKVTNREHNLLVFPEAFVPISRVPNLIEFTDSDCPINTVIIAGVESLPIQDIMEAKVLPLDDSMRGALEGAVGPHHKFVNACLILVRDRRGTRHVFVQLKMHPSHVEQTLRTMLTNDTVFFFTCPQLSFGVLICSDFIHRSSGVWLPVHVVDALQEAWNVSAPATSLAIDLLVNIQCNPKPNNRKFREAAKSVLYVQKDSVRLDQAFVLISNWGQLWDEEEPILSSSLVYKSQFWQPPPCNETNIPCTYSLTRDILVDDLNIAAFRSKEHGRCRFRMLPCSKADRSDPSRRFPLRECYFELLDGAGNWYVQQKTAWHDRCERWLPPNIPNSSFAHFWSLPNNGEVQSGIHRKYVETRQRILGKTDTDLKQDCLSLFLSSHDTKNPDMWGLQQRTGLNKWASIATLFHYEDQGFSFSGDEWFSFKWRNRICITVIDGQDLVSCAQSHESYCKKFGKRLPQDPKLNSVALVMLYRHTRDDRQIIRRVTPLSVESWADAGQHREGVRNEALKKSADSVTHPRPDQKLFWCTTEDFDIAWEAGSTEALRAAMEEICEPALD